MGDDYQLAECILCNISWLSVSLTSQMVAKMNDGEFRLPLIIEGQLKHVPDYVVT